MYITCITFEEFMLVTLFKLNKINLPCYDTKGVYCRNRGGANMLPCPTTSRISA